MAGKLLKHAVPDNFLSAATTCELMVIAKSGWTTDWTPPGGNSDVASSACLLSLHDRSIAGGLCAQYAAGAAGNQTRQADPWDVCRVSGVHALLRQARPMVVVNGELLTARPDLSPSSNVLSHNQ